MSITSLFKVQVEQDIRRCEGQKMINGSEGLYAEIVNRHSALIDNFMQNKTFLHSGKYPHLLTALIIDQNSS